MKKVLLLFALLISLVSCDRRTEDEIRKEKIAELSEGFNVVIIDSCEYLIKKDDVQVWNMGRGFGYMAHKGNCKFCEKRNKRSQDKNLD